jgi:hypothetical protein
MYTAVALVLIFVPCFPLGNFVVIPFTATPSSQPLVQLSLATVLERSEVAGTQPQDAIGFVLRKAVGEGIYIHSKGF